MPEPAMSSHPGRLAGRVVLITGAASGLGRAIAERFSREGARLMLVDRVMIPLLADAETLTADIADQGVAEEAVASCVSRHGRLDILVNNAATWTGTALLDGSDEGWHRVIDVNVTAAFRFARAAIAQMLAQAEPDPEIDEARGRILTLGSQHGIIASPGDLAYGVSKAACIHLARQIAHAHAADRIVSNALSPGKIVLPRSDPATHDTATARTPWPRLGRPEDVASAALFLCSREATYITGANLMVDGGWTAV